MQRKQSSTSYPILFFMADSSDHVTGKTGLSPTVTLSKNGGAFGAAAGAVSEVANGWYALAGNATDRDTLGELALHAAAAGADPADRYCEIVSYDPYSQAFDYFTQAIATLLSSNLPNLDSPISDVPSDVWDEVLTAATHNVPTSAGRRLRQLAGSIILDGAVVSSTTNTITFDGDASTADGAYDPSIIFIVDGPGAGQCRLILEYTGSTKTAVIDRDWKVLPTNASTYVIAGHPGREHVNEGLATGGAAGYIQLNALASSFDDAYNAQVVFIRSGTGADQARRVTDYDGATRRAYVDDWDVVPDTTSAYAMLPSGCLTDDALASAILDEPTASHVTAGTVGKKISEICCPLGSGANTFVYTVTDANTGLPVDEVQVIVTTDIAGANVIATAYTDAFGNVTFYLDSGTYYLWRVKSDYTFTNPDTEVIP